MGLLSHMEALHAVENQRLNGLTECSAFSSKTELFDFHSFAKKNDLPLCALMVPFKNRFYMRYSHGFDVETILKSVSSIDFWNGTIQSNEWISYENSALEPFYQFFSQQYLSVLNKIQIKMFEVSDTKAILIIVNNDILQENIDIQLNELKEYITSDLNNFPEYYIHQKHKKNEDNQNSKSFTVDFSDILNGLKNTVDSETQEILLPVIKSQIYNKISQIIDLTDYCFMEDDKIYIEFYSAQSLESDLLQFQINKILEDLLQDKSKKVSVYSTL